MNVSINEQKASLVSIVMATNVVNEQLWVAIDSCLNQTYENIEIIIVANGIKDEDYEKIKENTNKEGLIKLLRTDIKFLTFSLNLGIHAASGDYIARMDADDISYPDRIKKQIEFLDLNKNISVCGAWADLINEDGDIVGEITYPTKNTSIKKSLYYRNPIIHPTVMIRRSVLTGVGGYNGLFSEDLNTWLMMSGDKEINFENLPIKLLGYRELTAGHQRNKTWVKAKAGVAGAYLREFLVTKNFWCIVGLIINSAKSLFPGVRRYKVVATGKNI